MAKVLTSEEIEAARQYHREREARRRAQREAEQQRWLQRVRDVVARVAPQHPGVRRVILFGSLVRPGRFGPDSDGVPKLQCGQESRYG